MKRISDSWQGISRRQPVEQASSPERDAQTTGGGLRWWRLNDGQMQFMRYLVLLLAVGVVLMSLSSRQASDVGGKPTDDVAPPASSVAAGTAGPAGDYAREVERKLQEALLQLHGVGRVHVSVTVSAGAEKVLAEHITTERRVNEAGGGDSREVIDERITAQPVLVRSDQARQEHPIVILERTPTIQGVLVVTDAASDSRMRYEIARSVMTLLGLPAHRVYVLPQRW